MAKYDLYNIEERLKQYDDRVLRIDFNERRGIHLIVCWDPVLKEEYTAMTVKAGELDARVERRMMEINPNHFNAFDDIQQWQDEKDRNDERKIEDMAYGMADLLHKPLIRDAFY